MSNKFRYSKTDHYDPTEELPEGSYEVYLRETGEYVGYVYRDDSVPNGYWGRWRSGKYSDMTRDRLAEDLLSRKRAEIERERLARHLREAHGLDPYADLNDSTLRVLTVAHDDEHTDNSDILPVEHTH